MVGVITVTWFETFYVSGLMVRRWNVNLVAPGSTPEQDTPLTNYFFLFKLKRPELVVLTLKRLRLS